MKHYILHLARPLCGALVFLAAQAHAAILVTVNWDADTTADGLATGTLQGANFGPATINYSASGGSGGTLISGTDADWLNSSATDAVFSGHDTSGVLSESIDTHDNTITLTVANGYSVINPILLVNWTDASSSLTFAGIAAGDISVTDSNGASPTISGTTNAVVSYGGSNTVNDGFALQLSGTYTSMSFTLASSGETIGLSLAADSVNVVPEPSSYPIILGAAVLLVVACRRRR